MIPNLRLKRIKWWELEKLLIDYLYAARFGFFQNCIKVFNIKCNILDPISMKCQVLTHFQSLLWVWLISKIVEESSCYLYESLKMLSKMLQADINDIFHLLTHPDLNTKTILFCLTAWQATFLSPVSSPYKVNMKTYNRYVFPRILRNGFHIFIVLYHYPISKWMKSKPCTIIWCGLFCVTNPPFYMMEIEKATFFMFFSL